MPIVAIDLNTPVAKGFRRGTHRTTAPGHTLARVRERWRALGITRVANITGLDYIGIPVVAVCRPNARSLATMQGKGLDLVAAKASGVMEAAETYHAERIDRPVRLASYADLRRRERVADVLNLPRVRASRFDEQAPLRWIEGFDLLQDRPCWVPYQLVHTDYTRPALTDSEYFLATSNGLASGNHPLEAISHGICELVERDALALAALDDRQRTLASVPRLDLETVVDPDCRELLEKYRRAGISVTVWDITSDSGVACFLCRIAEVGNGPPYCSPAEGAGCHPTSTVALARALGEAAQSRLTIIAGTREDLATERYRAPRTKRAGVPLTGPTRAFAEVPSFVGETFNDDVRWLLGRLRTCSIAEAVMIDLSRPEFGMPVVRMVIPGLEGLSTVAGYRPGARASAKRDQTR